MGRRGGRERLVEAPGAVATEVEGDVGEAYVSKGGGNIGGTGGEMRDVGRRDLYAGDGSAMAADAQLT